MFVILKVKGKIRNHNCTATQKVFYQFFVFQQNDVQMY